MNPDFAPHVCVFGATGGKSHRSVLNMFQNITFGALYSAAAASSLSQSCRKSITQQGAAPSFPRFTFTLTPPMLFLQEHPIWHPCYVLKQIRWLQYMNTPEQQAQPQPYPGTRWGTWCPMHEDRHTDTGTQLCKAVTPQTACSAHLQTPACSCAALQGDVHCHRGLQTCTRFHLQSLPLPPQAGKHVGISASTQFCIYTCVCIHV